MFSLENLRAITINGNNGGNLYFYFNEDGSDVTASGFFASVRLSVGDVIEVWNGEVLAEYVVSSKSSNSATVEVLRDVDTIKSDLDDLGDQVATIESKIPAAPTVDGVYTMTCTVTDGKAVYSWEAQGE